ncbi:MAG: hypothetical protein K2J82_09610 [Muribaculaceae bacterium]|nr:hypothetical protein [Muribaculaceae bacterium]
MNKRFRTVASLDDNTLLRIIETEFKNNPDSFSSGPIKEGFSRDENFLKNTSARTIPQIEKWL